MDVSLNGGTPKSSILIGFSIINLSFWGTTIFGNPHVVFRLIFVGWKFGWPTYPWRWQKDTTNSTEFPSAQVDGSLSGLDEAAIIGADDADAETNGRTNEWWHMDDSNMTWLLDIWKFRGMFGMFITDASESSMNLV